MYFFIISLLHGLGRFVFLCPYFFNIDFSCLLLTLGLYASFQFTFLLLQLCGVLVILIDLLQNYFNEIIFLSAKVISFFLYYLFFEQAFCFYLLNPLNVVLNSVQVSFVQKIYFIHGLSFDTKNILKYLLLNAFLCCRPLGFTNQYPFVGHLICERKQMFCCTVKYLRLLNTPAVL